MKAEFLLEILSEETPAKMQIQAAEDIKKLMEAELQAKGLSFSNVDSYVTPRRLTVVGEGLPIMTSGSMEERRGPRVGSPEAAIQGFLRSTGMALDQCSQRDGYYYASIETKPSQTHDVLPDVIQSIFSKLTWPKSMVWALGSHEKSQYWVRPVRSVLAIFNGQPLSCDLPTLGLVVGSTTQGHRFLAPGALEVSSFADYQAKLEKAFVILSHQDRQKRIQEGLEALAQEKGLTVQPDLALLQEVAGLVEYPVPLLGRIDPQFMALPKPVLSTSMRVHQKYFTLLDKQGRLAPYFGVVANCQGRDGNTKMRQGYERILRARLSDAAFFYDQDVRVPLQDFAARLNVLIFQDKLGAISQKSERLAVLMAAQDAGQLGERAAQLAKADLLTAMVGEFPELQGIVGGIYAAAQGEASEVAAALQEQYQPQGSHSSCPTAPVSVSLALADRLDTLVGFLGTGKGPTGSKDPFALRRAALGIIRLIRENQLSSFSLRLLGQKAMEAYNSQGIVFKSDFDFETVLNFLKERLKVVLRGEGMRHDSIASVLDQTPLNEVVNTNEVKQSQELVVIHKYVEARRDNIFSLSQRVKALESFLGSPQGEVLSATFRRVNGIVDDETRKDNHFHLTINPALLLEESEMVLYNQLEQVIKVRESLLDAHDYTGWMTQLATLHDPAASFFDALKVNHEDQAIRANRLGLLTNLKIQMELVGNFSKIEG